MIIVVTALMLFSMFFGAGNLIFPPMIGVEAGTSFWPAILGFIGSGVILPVLAVIAISLSGNNVRDLARRGGVIFGIVFPILAYLSIGAFYALPRTGAVSFETAITPITGWDSLLASGIFNTIFFGIALALSWNPNTIMDSLGKFLTPALVILLIILITLSVTTMNGEAGAPTEKFADAPMATGLLEGYLTMDSIAALAFSIVVISTLRYKGFPEGKPLVTGTILAGAGAGLLLAMMYLGLGFIGRVIENGEQYENGAPLLSDAALQTMGQPGQIIFALIVLLACMTTAVGLITSTSEFFNTITPGVSYKTWAVIFAVASAAMATQGLSAVMAIAAPVITFLYPPAIALIFIALIEPLFRGKTYFYWAYRIPLWVAAIWSAYSVVLGMGWLPEAAGAAVNWSPMQDLSLGWVLPVVVAFIIGLVIDFAQKREAPADDRSFVARMAV
ncbi:branched-chain amino acid transport system II carrier protein [Corynebacterium breve]|uniref:Branched-chain amino acid transport system II carrier protein n=1 Tax=Corynebacterium breve TaxID=3049799 RepID=A0ABY8VJ08_9CORY|nr:branched-chain amino acid transport system II carrier protein [Corynebacterium breve]WIM69052.1 branched-chain amino acid transport system II carrier protein [Corynebacterium breve]